MGVKGSLKAAFNQTLKGLNIQLASSENYWIFSGRSIQIFPVGPVFTSGCLLLLFFSYLKNK